MLFKNKPTAEATCSHKFEPRYDETPTGMEMHDASGNIALLRDLLFYKVYVKDICVKCGKEIKK